LSYWPLPHWRRLPPRPAPSPRDTHLGRTFRPDAASDGLLALPMRGVFPAVSAELVELQPLGTLPAILRGAVVAAFAVAACQRDDLAHTPLERPNTGRGALRRVRRRPLSTFGYSTISVMVPAPTVRPPSRIANRAPFSSATGVSSSPLMVVRSPGITISTPSGSLSVPVTSVVRM